MIVRFKQSDLTVLAWVAEHRLLTVRQLAALSKQGVRATQRRLTSLARAHLLQVTTTGYGQKRGRPQQLVSLTPKGSERLRAAGELGRDVPDHRVTAERITCREHQLLVNWFQIQLHYVEKHVPGLQIRFLSPTSPSMQCDSHDHPFISDHAPTKGPEKGREVRFTPDGVFSIHDST